MTGRIYLDNAATSWPKSPSVIDAVMRFISDCGATAGRGSYRSAVQAERWLSEARLQLARLIGASQVESIAFCGSGTHALNAAIYGLLRDGQHVITTQSEHNSVLRPLAHLAGCQQIQLDFIGSDRSGVVSLEHARRLLRPESRWIVLGHASNVTGAVQDLSTWSSLARDHGVGLIVDASQTLGYLPMDVDLLNIPVLASAGHKGLGGIAGTGFLYVTKELHPHLRPLMTGGTGLRSESLEAVRTWPQVIEVGNHNLPGIVSMAVAAQELNRHPIGTVTESLHDWKNLFDQLLSGLCMIPRLSIVGFSSPVSSPNPESAISGPDAARGAETSSVGEELVNRVPLVSIQLEGWDIHDLASVLDSEFGIEVRAGYHCAALIHEPIGSSGQGGTLRLSIGHRTTQEDVQAVLAALTAISEAM